LTKFIINFDELHFGELFEVLGQRAGDVVQRAIRLATTGQIHMGDTIGKHKFAVTGETIEYEGEALIAFHIARAFEEFVDHGS